MKISNLKIIELTKKDKKRGHGAYGTYYKYSRTVGLKVQHNPSHKEAKKEMDLLNRANTIQIAPKCYEIVIVKNHKGKLSYGLLVEHVQGKHLRVVTKRQMSEAVNKLKKVGIVNDDLHEKNIIKTPNGRCVIIDFSPECCYKGSKWR